MEKIFAEILNMGYLASYAIVFVLLGRLCIQRAPKKYAYMLWAIPFLRLIVPFSIESVLSIMPQRAVVYTTATNSMPQVQTGINIFNQNINSYVVGQIENSAGMGANRMQIWVLIGEIVWLTGILALLLCSGFAMIHLRGKLIGSVHSKDNIWIADHVKSPFVVGVIRPRIYLPSGVNESEMDYMILHEQIHIRRRDYLVKIVIYAVLIVYWFHPLVWLAYYLCVKDMEMSCDEAVLREAGTDIRTKYADSLLKLATGRYPMPGAPIFFGESNTKSRIKNVLHYKRPAVWGGMAAVLLLIVLAVCLLSNPKQQDGADNRLQEATEQTTEQMQTTEQIQEAAQQNTEQQNTGYSIPGNSVTYNMQMDNPQSMVPHLYLDTTVRQFTFVSSLLSSVLVTGSYEIEDNILTATTEDGKSQYIFELVDDKTLRFIEEGSSEVIQYEEETPKIIDGTIFAAE